MRNFEINFIVFSPTPTYIDYIGGVMVNHSLAHYISSLGENCYIYADSTKEGYKTNLIPYGSEVEYDPQNTILICSAGAGEHTFEHYISKNLKGIPNQVKWLINDQVKYYPEGEKFYTYCDYFPTLENQKINGSFLSLDIEYDIFYNQNQTRNGGCYYTKGHPIKTQHHKDTDLSLDNIYNMPSHERNLYLSEVFNSKEYFICYSHRSFIAAIAALCGCTVIVIPYDDTSKEYWKENFPTFKYGIAYGENDTQWALDTKHLVKENLQNIQSQGIEDIKSFINDCYSWLENKYNLK
jgi:hypothetical protein